VLEKLPGRLKVLAPGREARVTGGTSVRATLQVKKFQRFLWPEETMAYCEASQNRYALLQDALNITEPNEDIFAESIKIARVSCTWFYQSSNPMRS
jgi:hypothetical protein